MGKLTNLNPVAPIADSDIPSTVARDAEVTAAINAHTSAADPHPQYLVQSEGDARYRQSAIALVDSDIPGGVARDAEVTAAINAHLGATDPHSQYATQARADARYGTIKKILFSGTTAASQGASTIITHGLIVSKIMAVNALVEHATGLLVSPSHTMSTGYEFNLSLDGTQIYVGNVATKSFNILSKPVRIVIDYSI